MTKFIPTRQGNLCQICGDTSGKCRETETTLLCMNITSAHSTPGGFKFIGLTLNGLWGKFIKDGRQNLTQQEREQWQQEQKLQKLLRLKAEHKRRSRSLSEPDRDKEIRKILAQLPLLPEHKADLLSRGLTDEQIASFMFRSVDQWQKLESEVSYKLAGVSIHGKSLITQAGYICPIFNPQGLITGWQLHTDNASDGGKYKWASSATSKRPNGASSHLPNGELPINYCRPLHQPLTNMDRLQSNDLLGVADLKNKPWEQSLKKWDRLQSNNSLGIADLQNEPVPFFQRQLPSHICLRKDPPLNELQAKQIGLTEGILKPLITASLRNQIVLGAAAGNFAASPDTFKFYLEQASVELGGTKDIILYADAGAIANPQVMNQYRRTWELVTKWGYTCRIGWWGQYSKTDCDIDELSADVEVEEITFAQFEANSRNPNRDAQGLTRWIKDLFGKLAKKADKQIRRFSDRNKVVLVEPDEIKQRIIAASLPLAIDYIPGSLPTPEQYKQLNCPKIRYKEGQRSQFWEETQTAGWQHILDNSAPGLGKSHDAGCAKPDNFGIEKLFYLSTDHRNPTTMTVEENYTDLTVRHNGLKLDSSRKTPLGHDFQVWGSKKSDKIVQPCFKDPRYPTIPSIEGWTILSSFSAGANSNSKPDTQGNCFRTDLFRGLHSKNIPNIEGKESPICTTCHLASACRNTSGPGFGFRSLRRDALSQLCVRAHPDSLPKTDEFDYNTAGAFWDETSTLLQAMKTLTFDIHDFTQVMDELESKLPEIYTALRPLRQQLRNLLKEEILPTSRYGFDDADVRALLPNKPENLADMINQIETALVPDLNFLESADGIDVKAVDKEYRAAAYTSSLIMRQQNYRTADKGINSVALNWLVPFLQVWNGKYGSLRCEYGKLTVYTRNDRHFVLANAFKFNIYLDATLTTKLLAVKLGVNQQDILEACETPPSYSNLQIIQVAGLGKLGKVRSETLTKRVNALKAELSSRHIDEIAFIDWKAQASDNEGYHFRDGRGINRFQDKSALVSVGVPYPNIGRLQAEFQTLTGCYVSLENYKFTEEPYSDKAAAENLDIQSAIQKQFQLFVSEHVQSEIIQEVGRLRSHKRPTEQLTYYFVGDYDLSFLLDTYSDAKFQCVEAFSITPLAGTPYEQNKWVILQAARQIIDSGKKLTQVEIAKIANMTQGGISRIASEFGGWAKFRQVLFALLEGLSNGDNATSVQDVETSWLAKTYLPLLAENPDNHSSVEIVKEVGALLLVYRHKMFCAILRETSIQTKATILGHLFRLFSEELREEFTSMLLN